MDTLTITKTLNESLKFEKQFDLLEKAQRQLGKVKHYYLMRERKLQELDSETCVYFPAIKRKIQHQYRKADIYYKFIHSRYRKTVNELNHNKI